MSKLRNVQHRPKREEAVHREMADTKRENNHLRRQVARLSRELEKRNEETSEAPLARREARRDDRPVNSKSCCAKMSLKKVILPVGTLVVCRNCLNRRIEK